VEAVRLWVQVLEFGYQQIIVRKSKGNKERIVPLPVKLNTPLQEHLRNTRQQHDDDLKKYFELSEFSR